MPDFTALGTPAAPRVSGGVATYQVPDMGGAARGMADAGVGLRHAAAIVAETNQRQDTMVAEDAFNRLQKQRLEEFEYGDGGFRSVSGSGAVGKRFLENYQSKFDTARGLIEQGLENDSQRRVFKQRAEIAALQYRSGLLHHQAQETDKFNNQTENDTVDLARRQIFSNPTDPIAVVAGLKSIDWAIDQKAQRLGWAAETTTDTKAKFRDKVWQDAAAILVEQDPPAALAALNKRLGVGTEAGDTGVTAIDNLAPDTLIQLRHRANAYVTQAQNRATALAEKRLKEAEKSYKDLVDFSLSGQMVSAGYEQQVIASTAGTPYEAGAKQLIQASYAGAMHGSQTLPQQEQALRVVDVQLAQGSTPEAAAIAQQMRTITNTQRAAYKDNPWAAAARFGRAPSVAEQPITDAAQGPALVAQRLGLMGVIEAYAGGAVSPLQPAEAQAFAAKLHALPPEARSEVLGQTGAMLSAPRVMALADQLDKKDRPLALALMMGVDRTTAGRAASFYVLRGAQALADKTVKEVASEGWRSNIAAKVRGSLGDDKAESDLIDAAYYVLAALHQDGIAPAGLKSMDANADSALGMVIGYPVERAGVKTFTPRGMNEREFDNRLKAQGEQLRAGTYFVRGQPVKGINLANHITEYGMKRDGQGRYIPVIRNAPVTMDEAGTQPLRLELR